MADISTESEADTRANRIDPALAAAGWGGADSRVRREVIAPGRITQGGNRVNPMSADYVLHHMGQKLAVIEAKKAGIKAAEGVGQAKEYARRLHTRFAYATNGLDWYEIDMQGGERPIPAPPIYGRAPFPPQTLGATVSGPFRSKAGAANGSPAITNTTP